MTLNNDPNILFSSQQDQEENSKYPLTFVPLNNTVPPTVVSVFWAGYNISDITGPTPFVDISYESIKSANGTPQGIRCNVTLTGKIVRKPSESGVEACDVVRNLVPTNLGLNGILRSASGLYNLFKTCPVGLFKIACTPNGAGGQASITPDLFVASGMQFVSFNIDKSNDNWVRTADYTIVLEKQEGLVQNVDEQVTDTADSWSIEPLDDSIYTKFVNNVTQRGEWYNPNLKPGAPGGDNATIPPGAVGVQAVGTTRLQVINIPQFRVTRRLSARGLSIASGSYTTTNPFMPNTAAGGALFKGNWMLAKAWVERRLAASFNAQIPGLGTPGSGIPYIMSLPMIQAVQTTQTFFFNHSRSVNVDVENSTYESTETWIAMPTGIGYTETYSLEASTNLEMIKTVRVAGNIQGLSMAPITAMAGASGVFATGLNPFHPTGGGVVISPPGQGGSLQINVQGLSMSGTGLLTPLNYEIDAAENYRQATTFLTGSKYLNALSGWINDIKPYLYRRACLAVNSPERILPYVPAYATTPPQVPKNPIYAKETVLSVIPVSTTEGHDPKKGTISYSYEYNNKFNIISGVISESINITHDNPSYSVTETQVPGRIMGPILTVNGRTPLRKTLNIELVVMVPTGADGFWVQNPACPMFTGGYLYKTVQTLVDGAQPFGYIDPVGGQAFLGPYAQRKAMNRNGVVYVASDQDTWAPTQGRYTRTVTWIYQQCTTDKFYLDH